MRYKIVTANYDLAYVLADKLRYMLVNSCETDHDYQYLFVIGGDGTFVKAAKDHAFIPGLRIIGINAGKIGFFSSFDCNNLDQIINVINQDDNDCFLPFPLIEFNYDLKNGYGFNDLVLASDTLINVEIFINKVKLALYRGSGLLIATKNGATGYNKSANGPIIFPQNNCWIINQLFPQNTNRFNNITNPIVLSDNLEINFKNLSTWKPVDVSVDGVKLFALSSNEQLNLKMTLSSAVIYLPCSVGDYIQKLQQVFLINHE